VHGGPRLLIALTSSCLFVSCSAREPTTACGQSSLVAGGNSASYLRLLPQEENAVAAVLPESPADAPRLCSGVLVASSWILTAAHCLGSGKDFVATVTFGNDARLSPFHRSVARAIPHPQVDFALLELNEAVDSEFAWPITIDVDTEPVTGELAQLAGWGEDSDGVVGIRRFAVEEIVLVTTDEVVVDGRNMSGACTGDSGGPLLTRDHLGRPSLLGVLSLGSQSCRRLDKYVRPLAAAKWMNSIMGTSLSNTAARPCGPLDKKGACFGQVAVWCERDELVADECPNASGCGWDTHQDGFRCVDPNDDPCLGIDEAGRCDGDIAATCNEGDLLEQDCGECARCSRSSITGQAACR